MSEISHPKRPEPGARLAFDVFHRCFVLIIFALCSLGFAQQRHNYLAVNGSLIDDAGPYYFIAQGDNTNAFAKAVPLAHAMGLEVVFESTSKQLIFSDGHRTATFSTTSDIVEGLPKRGGAVRLEPALRGTNALDSPLALLVDGTAYVPITPLVLAFEGESAWNSQSKVVTIDTADRLGYALPDPRVGFTDGVTRVAIDLPTGATYDVAAGSRAFIISLPGARSDPSTRSVDDANLDAVVVASTAGRVTITVHTAFELDATGSGYRLGTVQRQDGTTLYVDFAAGLAGIAVTAVGQAPADDGPQALALVPDVRQVVVIDAGHGGHDPGASSRHAVEEHVVLSVALKLKQRLEQAGLEVILTRDTDTFLTLQQRSAFATPERNIFVSIHANSAPSTNASGIETWVFGRPLDPSLIERAIEENGGGALGEELTEVARQTADEFAADILREAQLNYSLALAEAVQGKLVSATGARDRGVRANLFYVIRTARIPAILVELGFVSNPDEGAKLATEAYQDTLAEGLADGILSFLRGGGILANH